MKRIDKVQQFFPERVSASAKKRPYKRLGLQIRDETGSRRIRALQADGENGACSFTGD